MVYSGKEEPFAQVSLFSKAVGLLLKHQNSIYMCSYRTAKSAVVLISWSASKNGNTALRAVHSELSEPQTSNPRPVKTP